MTEVRGRPDVGALEAFALILGVRGAQWRTLVLCARAFSQWFATTRNHMLLDLAHACLACALQACPIQRRVALARDTFSGHILHAEQIPPFSEEPASHMHATPDQDAAYLRQLPTELSPEASVAILHCALHKRGGVTLLCKRLPSYLHTASAMLRGDESAWQTHDEEATAADIPRSVKTL